MCVELYFFKLVLLYVMDSVHLFVCCMMCCSRGAVGHAGAITATAVLVFSPVENSSIPMKFMQVAGAYS